MPSAFAKKLAEQPPKPAAVLVLKPEHYASDWPDRPKCDVAAGLRTLSERELQQIAGEAGKDARLHHPDAESTTDGPFALAFEDAVVRLAAGRCLTNPNDATDPFFAAADEMVGMAFTPKTIRYIWDQLEKFTIANSPVMEAATDDDITQLIGVLDLVEKLAPAAQLRMRKLLGFCLEELQAVQLTLEGDDG
jgi:hypothetical protein